MTEKTEKSFFQEFQVEYQAHTLVWRKAIDKSYELSPEEKELLSERVNPLFKELQVVMGMMASAVDESFARMYTK